MVMELMVNFIKNYRLIAINLIDFNLIVSHIFKNLVEHPIQNLFMWAIFLNRIEIAKIFWQIGQVKIRIELISKLLYIIKRNNWV